MSRVRSGLAVVLLGLGACYTGPVPTVRPGEPAGCGVAPGEGVAEAVDELRRDRGLSGITVDPRLVTAAERHSADMARHGFIGHTGSDGSSFAERAAAAGYPPVSMGEVVAAGYASPESVVAGWLRSRGHRDILLGRSFRHIGAACVASGAGTPYWAAVLAD